MVIGIDFSLEKNRKVQNCIMWIDTEFSLIVKCNHLMVVVSSMCCRLHII